VLSSSIVGKLIFTSGTLDNAYLPNLIADLAFFWFVLNFFSSHLINIGGGSSMDPFVEKYADKKFEDLTNDELMEIMKHYFEKVMKDIDLAQKNFIKNEENQEWTELRKTKDANYIIAIAIAGYLKEQCQNKTKESTGQKYCHECGAQLLK
jgi:hypothetical protein